MLDASLGVRSVSPPNMQNKKVCVHLRWVRACKGFVKTWMSGQQHSYTHGLDHF